MDLDILPRTWYPSPDVFPAALISFSATCWQSTLSLTPVDETRMWSFRREEDKERMSFVGSFFVSVLYPDLQNRVKLAAAITHSEEEAAGCMFTLLPTIYFNFRYEVYI